MIAHTPESDSGTGSVCSDYLDEVEVEKEVVKKIIKPDILAMTKLLNFEEVLRLYNLHISLVTTAY